ncbi:MAG: PAS domain S-box protein [Nitrospirota bacterium]|nr:PAS domain S-box protein [Nitrospirota bacterium]MDE3226325.1 PAS domain S-box protein [Nitrospirota bacterium]MDE3242723.1 PAS domain S-box protein [Nitrospirota bacterium]
MEDLRGKLHWLMGLRVVVVTLLLGLSLAFQIAKGELVFTFYALIVLTYAITIAYALTLRYLTDPTTLRPFASFQLGMDLLLETFLIASTGGVESPFSSLYVITVALASLILRRRGGLIIAGVSVILFGVLTNIQLYGLLASHKWLLPSRLSAAEATQALLLHGLALVLVGWLSGTLAEQLRRTGQTLIEKEQGLVRLQAFHENVVQSISSGLFTADPEGRITSFNRAAQEVTGHTLEAVLGRLWWEVFHWEQGDLFSGVPVNLAQPQTFEAEGQRADGTRLVLGVTLSPLNEQGTQTGLVGVFKDLTQVRDMQEAMRRREWLATLGEMSAGMAHEIRNPLAALAGAMQMLRRDVALEETNARLMDIAVREATRLDAIITEFLLYARPPALNLKECDVNEVLSETLDLLRHQAASRPDVRIVPQLRPGPMTARVDPDQIKQVFWNLATNALEAMPSGGQLAISTGRRWVGAGTRSGDVIEITFHDTGEGIKSEALDKIFLPFFTTKREGSGLGLAAVHRIVDLHGGWIRVDSQEGKGSRFVVCLPVSAQEGPRLWYEGREPWGREPWKKF